MSCSILLGNSPKAVFYPLAKAAIVAVPISPIEEKNTDGADPSDTDTGSGRKWMVFGSALLLAGAAAFAWTRQEESTIRVDGEP